MTDKKIQETVDKLIASENFTVVKIKHNINNTFNNENIVIRPTFFDTDVFYCEDYCIKIKCILALIKKKKLAKQMDDMFFHSKLKKVIRDSLPCVPTDISDNILNHMYDDNDYSFKVVTSSGHDIHKDMYVYSVFYTTLIVIDKANLKIWKWILGTKLNVYWVTNEKEFRILDRKNELNEFDCVIVVHPKYPLVYRLDYRWARVIIERPVLPKRNKIKLPSCNFLWLLADLDSPYYMKETINKNTPRYINSTQYIFQTDWKKNDPCALLKPLNERVFYSDEERQLLKCRIDNSYYRCSNILKDMYQNKKETI